MTKTNPDASSRHELEALEIEHVDDGHRPAPSLKTRSISSSQDNHRLEESRLAGTTKQPKPTPRWKVCTRYVGLASLAMVLTVTCPHTDLWHQGTADVPRLCKLLFLFATLLFTFALLQGSDPGYLSKELLQEMENRIEDSGHEDGRTLLDHEQHREEIDHQLLDNNTTKSMRSSLTESSIPTRRQTLNGGNHASPSLLADPLTVPGTDNTEQRERRDESSYYHSTRRKYCETCQFAPPLRAHHCKVCQTCVATFDHHCEFVGTCIGERNHCRFWFFLTAQTFGFWFCCSIVSSSSLGFLSLLALGNDNQYSPEEAKVILTESLRVVISKLYLYPLTFASVLVFLAHSFFALANSTTFEFAKGPRHLEYLKNTEPCDLPFSRGVFSNLLLFCCERDAACNMRILTPSGIMASIRQIRRQSMLMSPNWADDMWNPIVWRPPGKIVRDSDDWWEHPWENKYWSCC